MSITTIYCSSRRAIIYKFDRLREAQIHICAIVSIPQVVSISLSTVITPRSASSLANFVVSVVCATDPNYSNSN